MQIATKIIISLLCFICFSQLKAQESKDSFPILHIENPSYNFGDIEQGKIVEHSFNIKNNGNLPLIISNVITTCGCTAPEWPKEPIAPNNSTSIKIVFDSRGKAGIQNKVVTIISNAQIPQSRIKIKANVIPKN